MKEWIASIEGGQSPDKLTTLDKIVDGQIGGLGTLLENVVGTNRGVPLFEFRDLNSVQASRMQGLVADAENAVLSFHDQYKGSPQRQKHQQRPALLRSAGYQHSRGSKLRSAFQKPLQ